MNKVMKAVAALMLMAAVVFAVGCVKDPTNVNVNENVGYDIPQVETSIVQEITETSALGGGVVTSSAGGQIIERGLCWGTESNPSVSGNHFGSSHYEASSFEYRIEGLEPNTLYHVRAYAINSVGIGYGADVSFTTLCSGGGNTPPGGAIHGVFSVSSSKRVYFSKGNLQYDKITQEWSFMEHQYDVVERDGQDVGTNYANQNIVSLFCFGMSGFEAKYPYLTATDHYSNYHGGDIYGGNYDWGIYNCISNGGNQSGLWWTLRREEWDYVINQRVTTSGIRYAKAVVNGMNGLILLPDEWNPNVYMLNQTNKSDALYSYNRLSISQWSVLENAGAVFLPATGYRNGTSVYDVGSSGGYWSASCDDNSLHFDDSHYPGYYYHDSGYSVYFYGAGLYISSSYYYRGHPVRLVCLVE